ncbi:5-oxoprolinase subunit B family protein [Methylocella tundrae]|uniref:Sensor histidine kinase inhibitor, KipI family n=1 Tax=Methylocella tundrae TaxID=227605 RepID=A0A4U8Z159_METTU|nr:allophanate hydrolase subunit 1 [Methylocella tundrae]WPP06329.1 allophanate hydrolase subunit 1 [Methylocella tundrae]VFU09025.1 Sensor histidine kinase inhibitor, KipI family [Methylocella tundrae]
MLKETPAAAAPRYLVAGESALVVEFGQCIDASIHECVLALDEAIAAARLDGVLETVPTYRSLMIHFDPKRTSTRALAEAIARLDAVSAPRKRKRRWRVPVCYDPPFAEDLGEVSQTLALTADEIIALHSSALYRVYMYGFAPGFTFLGGLPDALAISRRAAPRPPAPPGSLLIAGGQALVASIAMPTGWYQIGRTPLKIFDPRREPMFLIDIGDDIRFERIDGMRFAELSLAADDGSPIAHCDEDEEDPQAPTDR